MTTETIKRDGTYLSADGRRFLCLGAHWVPAAGLHWPTNFDPDAIRREFAALKELGSNTVRVDLFWGWFEKAPGLFNEEAFQQLDTIIGLCREIDLYLHPVLFIGGETGYYDVPWRHGRHPHGDPDMLRLETDHAAAIVRRYSGEPRILAWDLSDEPPFWIARGINTTDAMGVNWTRLISGAVRRESPDHLICVGTDQEDMRHGPFRPDLIIDEVDFLSVHPYPIYQPNLFPDPMLSMRATYAAAFQTALSTGAGKPTMVHELGSSSAQYDPELIAAYDRTQIWSSIGAGANGILMWDANDAAPKTWEQAPYRLAPHETQFGLSTHDLKDRPAGRDVRKIFGQLSTLDLIDVEPAAADAGILVPWEWVRPEHDQSNYAIADAPGPYIAQHQISVTNGVPAFDWRPANTWLVSAWLSSFIMLRQAGFKPGFPREYKSWKSYSALYLPAPLTSTSDDLVHPHTVFWSELKHWVEAGGAVYASFCADAAIPEMADFLGARLADHVPVETVEITVVEDYRGLRKGEVFRFKAKSDDRRHWASTFEMTGGHVIATDQDGRPALVANSFGKGQSLLCAYPIETYIGETPLAFEQDHLAWKIYAALTDATPVYRSNDPVVEVSHLSGPRGGYLVLTNHSGAARQVRLEQSSAGQTMSITLNGTPLERQADDAFAVEVPAWDGVLLTLKPA